jgi:probable poly-beta-1,6-N-acetyl-D-glucosamine export protein
MDSINTGQPTKKSNYDFVDHIRALAIIAIVGEHCLTAGVPLTSASGNYGIYLYMMQATKFGTISFFLLAGFLISDKFTTYTPGEYLKRRFNNTFGPWLFWSLVFLAAFAINLRVKENIYHDGRFNMGAILAEVKEIYLYTNYWFIINFMISITLLLIFKRFLYNKWFGLVLLSFTVFYSINVHYEWISAAHTTAILGFVFFLWLGAQLRKNFAVVDEWSVKTPYGILILLVVATGFAAVQEALYLEHHHSVHNFNTLKATNILYSLSMFALLLKIRTLKPLYDLKPRDTTFGIYLVHAIILGFVTPEILRPLHIDAAEISLPYFVAYKTLFFLLSYAITWIIVRAIGLTKAKGIIGT